MIFKSPSTPTPDGVLADYVRLFNIAQVLDPDDVTEMATRWAAISEKPWYVEAANEANRLAVKSGRLTEDGIVTGSLDDPEQGMIAVLAGAVPGGGVVDVATAVLVRDLLPAVLYRKLTNWWSRHPSTWLPGDEVSAAPADPPPPPPPPLVQKPEQMHVPPSVQEAAQEYVRRFGADVAAAGADPIPITDTRTKARPGPPAARTSPAPQPRRSRTGQPAPAAQRPVAELPREKVLPVAAERAWTKTKKRRKAGWANLRGGVLLTFGLVFCFAAVGDQLGAQMLPPASIANFGHGWGRLICTLFWLALMAVSCYFAQRQFILAKDIRGGRAS